jgi:hypothetical protein
MRVPKNHILYPRKKILEVLRTLNELVVSLDQLGSAEMTKQEHNAAVSDFLQRHRIFRKSARARQILSEPFPTAVGADGMDELEREMQYIQYWKDRRKKR